MDTVELLRDGRSYDMSTQQITSDNLALAYGLDPRSVFLRGSDNQLYFPVNGTFSFPEPIGTAHVEGNAATATATPPVIALTGTEAASNPSTPCSSGRGKGTISVKIIKAIQKGTAIKPEFLPSEVGYVEVNQATANICNINQYIQRKWGVDYYVVSNDGLPIIDGAGTQGLKFWRVGSRKLYAVKKGKGKGKRKRPRAVSPHGSSDSDNDRSSGDHEIILRMDRNLQRILDVSNKLNLPVGFLSLLSETFLCKICQTTISPPAIYARCCKAIVGCQRCVDRWYRGEAGIDRSCPLCRGERGLADTSHILGMDEFLLAVDQLVSTISTRFVPSPPTDSPRISD